MDTLISQQESPKYSKNLLPEFCQFDGLVTYDVTDGGGSVTVENSSNYVYAGKRALEITFTGPDVATISPTSEQTIFTAPKAGLYIMSLRALVPADYSGTIVYFNVYGFINGLGAAAVDFDIYSDVLNGFQYGVWNTFYQVFELAEGDTFECQFKTSSDNVGSTVSLDGFKVELDDRGLELPSRYTPADGVDYQIYDNLSAQGTDNTTTSELNYGVNRFIDSNPTNHCTKLPQPTTGKSLKICNNSNYPISVHPSNVGGSIGNLPADTPMTIPNNGGVYEFICVENPAPGEWAATVLAPVTFTFADIEIPHTTGTETNKVGLTTGGLVPAAGLGLDGGGNLLFTGEWQSENVIATLVSVLCQSNVVGTDCASIFGPDRIAASILTAYKDGVSSTTNGTRHQVDFLPGGYYTGSITPTGTLNSPEEIGDTGTLYKDMLAGPELLNEQLGLGGDFSRAYYTFAVNIPASAATKTYKFRWTINYI